MPGPSRKPEEYNDKWLAMRTAYLTAFPKIFTDLPDACRIFTASLELSHAFGFSFEPNLFVPKLAIELEGRHKAVSSQLTHWISQYPEDCAVIELASGLSARHLEFPNVPYFEVDLPTVISLKTDVYRALGWGWRSNFLIGADFSEEWSIDSLYRTVSATGAGHIALVSEGLFWYLSSADMKNLTEGVCKLLSLIPGIWVTGDCPPRSEDELSSESYRNVISTSAEVDVHSPFEGFTEFATFFGSFGFDISPVRIEDAIDVNSLVTPRLFGSSNESLLVQLRSYADVASMAQIDRM